MPSRWESDRAMKFGTKPGRRRAPVTVCTDNVTLSVSLDSNGHHLVTTGRGRTVTADSKRWRAAVYLAYSVSDMLR